MMCFKKNYSF